MSTASSLLLLVWLGLASVSTALPGLNTYHQEYFPEYRSGFQAIISSECSTEYCEYLWKYGRLQEANFYNIKCNITQETYTRTSCISEGIDSKTFFNVNTPELCILNCMLNHTPEVIKVRMGSAQVLLGLMPSLLAMLAPATWQIGSIIVVGRKPLLGFLLAVASPVVTPVFNSESSLPGFLTRRTGERVRVPRWILRSLLSEGARPRSSMERAFEYLCWLILYLLAMASVANVADLAYRAARQVIFSLAPGERWMLFLWIYGGAFPHALGIAAVALRVKKLPQLVESLDLVDSSRRKPRFQLLNQSFVSTLLSWLTATGNVLHTMYGTLIFSSILFISVEDAAWILFRLFASTITAYSAVRIVIAINRRQVQIVPPEESEDFRTE
jgi:hypothetical protein